MFAIDTNLLVYAHNKDSEFHVKGAAFIEKVMNERDENGRLSVCLPAQVLMEFVYVMTRQQLESPLSLPEATEVVGDYLDTGITIITQRETHIDTFLELLKNVTSRKRVFDVALAACLKDNQIAGIYTADVDHFEEFDFLAVMNPVQPDEDSTPTPPDAQS